MFGNSVSSASLQYLIFTSMFHIFQLQNEGDFSVTTFMSALYTSSLLGWIF